MFYTCTCKTTESLIPEEAKKEKTTIKEEAEKEGKKRDNLMELYDFQWILWSLDNLVLLVEQSNIYIYIWSSRSICLTQFDRGFWISWLCY